MGKCILCGRKGFFVKVHKNGLCDICENKRLEEEKIKFETYYNGLLEEFKNLKETIVLSFDPIEALEMIPSIENRIQEFEKFKRKLRCSDFPDMLSSKLIDSVTFRNDFSKRYGHGELKDWDLSVYLKSSAEQIDIDEVLSSIDKTIDSFQRKLKQIIHSIKKCADFQRIINDIPSYDIQITDTTHDKKSVSELEEKIKYTNITGKTSFDRIGSFVVIDAETTGLSATKDKLIEVAAIKFEDWTPVEKFHTMINPGKHISDSVSNINHIYDEMVVNAPTFSQIIDSLNAFVGNFNIVGHNLPFDLKFLYRHGYDFTLSKRYYYDTCEISKKILKKPKMKWDKTYGEYTINENYDYDVEDYKLNTLCDYYKIRDNTYAHRALSDAFATGLLFENLAKDKIDY